MKNFICILSLGVIILLASCSSNTNTKTAAHTYKTITPIIKDTVYTKEYIAEINALQNVEIRARVSGFIESLFVDEGQTVKKGQVLFTKNNRQFLQDLQGAKAVKKRVQAELKAAEIELNGAQKLLEKNFISQPEYDLSVTKLNALKAALDEALSVESQAQLNLSFVEVRAPFDGVINRIPHKEGSLVEQGDRLTVIDNNKEMLVYFNLSEADYLKYAMSKEESQNKEVTLVLADGTPYPYTGVIETTESAFNNNTGTIAFRAKFPNPDNILKRGATGKVQIHNRVKNALLIPQKVTFDRQEHLCVYVVDDNDIIRVRKITPSMRLPHLFAVKDGLSPQDNILYEGIQHVKEGDKISPELSSFSPVVAHP